MRIPRFLGVLMVGLMLALAGCKGATKAGTPYTLKPDRELEARLPGDLRMVHEAALRAVRDEFGYQVEREGTDALEGIIIAKTIRNDTVRVETYREAENMTRIEVFYGPLGDEAAASQILSEIEENVRD